MRKFSKLNENIQIDTDKLNSALSKLNGLTYKVYDYFYYKSTRSISLYRDIKNIESGYLNSKVIHIDPNFETKSGNIEEWYELLKFTSSGLSFFDDINSTKLKFQEIFNLIDELKEFSPSLCLKDNYFIIYLLGDEVTESDLKVKEDMIKAYDKLYKEMIKHKNIFEDVTFWRQYNDLHSKLVGDWETTYPNILASLCPQMSNESEYDWMKDEKVNDDIDNIRDIINEMGFNITFQVLDSNKFKFSLVEL